MANSAAPIIASSDVESKLAALELMTPAELRRKWLEVFGEETKSHHRAYLVARIAWRIQEQAYGGLSEAALERAEELADPLDLRLSAPKASGAELLARLVLVKPPPKSRDPRLPPVGETLARTYKGREIRVEVLEKGFRWEGKEFRSLTGVAKAVTGQKWNGFDFFHLNQET